MKAISVIAIGLLCVLSTTNAETFITNTMQQRIVAKESEELDALKNGDLNAFASLLADEAVFLNARGPSTKAEVVKHIAEFKLLEYSMEDVKFVPVSKNSGLIAYKLTEKSASHGREFSGQVYVSALWTEREGKWVCLFSQETAAK
jgi:ketosteroid isomerase-like protein